MANHYVVRIVSSARKRLLRIPEPNRERIRRAIRQLAEAPRPAGVEALKGRRDDRLWRIRVGDYRVIYEIHDDALLVLVIGVGPRGSVYRDISGE